MDPVPVEYVERDAADARLAVIWLHGLGADGHDFEPVVDELGLDGVRFVFPHAPVRPITINNGLSMRGWFDIAGFGPDSPQDEAGIRQSAATVDALIEHERERGMPSGRILLAGFSQGGAIALHAGLRAAEPLAGVLALSSFLPLAETLPAEKSAANAAVPIMMMHGDADPVIPMQMAEQSRRRLEQEGYAVEWRRYAMGHGVCLEQIRDIEAWLRQRLGGS